jgi:glycosyltransferase involved in cell wall biosynthesis
VLHQFGGAVQRRIVELARQQAAQGHEVIVFSPGESAERRPHAGAEIRFIPCRSGPRLGWIELQVRAMAQLRKEPVDVVHFHGQAEGAFIGGRIRAPKVLSYDYFYFRRGLRGPVHACYRRFLGAYDALLPVSRYCEDESVRYWDLGGQRTRVVFNGVNREQFRPEPALAAQERERLGLRQADRVVLYVGRVNRQKGTDVLIDACRALNARRDDTQLVVAGPLGQFGNGQTDPDGWQAQIEAVGGRYLGPVAEDRLVAIYNLADVFVMPTTAFEMFGMAAVEAQACGKPTVASDHGGLKETVPESCGGRFPVGDATALADRISTLLDDPAGYDRAAANALANAATYDWSAVAARLEDVYREVGR